MANFKSVWCEDLDTTALKPNARLVYSFINGKDENGYTWSEVSSFLATATQEDIQRAVDSLLDQSGDQHHVFIEGFDLREDGSFEVCLGS